MPPFFSYISGQGDSSDLQVYATADGFFPFEHLVTHNGLLP